MSSAADDDAATRIADIMVPYANVPDFLKYGEDLGKSPVQRDAIKKHLKMFMAMREIVPSLHWSQNAMKQIFQLVQTKQEASSKWSRPLTPKEGTEYRDRMSKRCRTLARHIKQGEAKDSKWLLDLITAMDGPDAGDGEHCEAEEQGEEEEKEHDEVVDAEVEKVQTDSDEVDKGEAEQDDPKKAEQSKLDAPNSETVAEVAAMKRPAAASWYGFDPTICKAWRQPSTANGRREVADLQYPDDAADDDFPTAKFLDGDERRVVEITVGELRAKDASKLRVRGAYWVGQSPNGDKMWVTRM